MRVKSTSEGLPWCILTNLSASHIFFQIEDDKGCSRAKYKSILSIEERLEEVPYGRQKPDLFLGNEETLFHNGKLN